MKTPPSFGRIVLLALALGTAGVTATIADDATPATTPPAAPAGAPDKPKHGGFGGMLTDAEKAQLQKAHDAAIAADPTLKTEEDALAAKRATIKDASDADKQAYFAEAKAFREKMRKAELAIDPTLAPIFAKMDAAMKKRGGPGGGAGGPPPAAPAPAGA